MMEEVLFTVLFELWKVWMEKLTATCKPFFPSIKVKSTDLWLLVFHSAFCVTSEYWLNNTWYWGMGDKVSFYLSSQEPCLPWESISSYMGWLNRVGWSSCLLSHPCHLLELWWNGWGREMLLILFSFVASGWLNVDVATAKGIGPQSPCSKISSWLSGKATKRVCHDFKRVSIWNVIALAISECWCQELLTSS